MDRERLDSWCERGVLGLVLAVLVYSPLATGSVRPQDFVVVEWLTVGVLFLWGCRFWLNPKHRLLWPWVSWGVLAFMLYAVGRYLTADIEYVARQELIKVLVYGFLFFAILNNLHRLETTQIVGMTLIGLATLIAFYGVFQFLTDSERVWHFIRPESYFKRGSGTFINPNHLAGYLEMILPLALAYTLTGRFKHVEKVLLGYASLVIFAGITVTISRGGWAATSVALVVLFFWLMRQRDYRLQSLFILGGLAAIIVAFAFTAQLSEDRKGRLSLSQQASDLRFKLWQPAVNMWQDHFWWGAGPAHFDYRFRQYRPGGELQLQVRPERVHNDYLNTLADWGLVGALLVAAVWLVFYGEVFRSWKYVQRSQNDLAAKRSNKSSFVMGGALGLLAILVHSVVDFNMHIPSNAILAVTLLALVSGHFRFATERYWHTVRWPLRIVVMAFLSAGLIYLGKQSWQRTIECYWLAKAEAQPRYSDEQVAALRKALAVEDKNFETAYRLGEALRAQSWQGDEDYRELARAALPFFERAMALNPYDSYSFLRYGMCLHWLGEHDRAGEYFERAYKLDPNGHYTVAHVGWHYVQLEDWTTAKQWFEKSLQLNWVENTVASTYLQIVTQKLAEAPADK